MITIAVLGMGAMGSRVAARLLAAGYRVQGWNRSPAPLEALRQAGGRAAETPRRAVAGADIVLSVLRDDDASRVVWSDDDAGALAGLAAGALVLECSTLTPAWIAALAGRVSAHEAMLLDAPMVGSRPQAEAGELVFLVGGEASGVSRAIPLFECLGRAHHHVGGLGHGTALKLAVNALFAAQVAQMAELLQFLGRSGLDGARALEVMQELPVTSPAAAAAGSQILREQFAPLFPIPLVAKDLSYAAAAAQRSGTGLPLSEAAATLFRRAERSGLDGLNITGIARLVF